MEIFTAIWSIIQMMRLANLHMTLESLSGHLAPYIDDIDLTMRQFADGNFNFKPQVEWKAIL